MRTSRKRCHPFHPACRVRPSNQDIVHWGGLEWLEFAHHCVVAGLLCVTTTVRLEDSLPTPPHRNIAPGTEVVVIVVRHTHLPRAAQSVDNEHPAWLCHAAALKRLPCLRRRTHQRCPLPRLQHATQPRRSWLRFLPRLPKNKSVVVPPAVGSFCTMR